MTEETPEHPAKTAIDIMVKIAAVLEQADKIAKGDGFGELDGLRSSLEDLPPADMNLLLQHIQSMYSACEGMAITKIAFRCDTDRHRVIVIVGIQFGIREIELFAPFDLDGSKNMLQELVGSLNLLQQTQTIILPPAGNA